MNENYNSDLGRKTYKKKIPHRRNLLRNHQKNHANSQKYKRRTIKKAQTELTLQTIAHNIKNNTQKPNTITKKKPSK